MRGLYPIVDLDALNARGLELLSFAEHLLEARPPLLQLRAKHAPARDTLELLRGLLPLCRRAGALLFANDRPDLALLAGADGVHVGQEDLSLADVRAFAPALRVGVSTHTLAQVSALLDERPDYIAFGPVFPTRSKEQPETLVGVELLAQAHELTRARGVPLCAIGGIDLERAPEIRGHCELVSLIAALLPEGAELARVPQRARALAAALAV